MTVDPSEGYSGKCRALFLCPKAMMNLVLEIGKDWERRTQIDA